jgi:RHS repeat-associated protein
VAPITDASGSVLALADSSGALVTQYSYDPFGNTTTSGAVNGNPSQYTGRDNEGNGLYYYRARYYNPSLGRFISEDPAGDGLNFYAYAGDDPIDFSDPFGLSAAAVAAEVVNDGWRVIQGGARIVRIPSFKGNLAIFALSVEITIASEEVEWAIALHHESTAYDEGVLAIQKLNLALLAKPSAPATPAPAPLAGRYSGGGCLPGANSGWGKNRLIKELHDRGFLYTGPTRGDGGLMYRNPDTGEAIRIMPKPCRMPFRNDPPEKFENDWYYRYQAGPGQPWGPHTTIPNN